MEQIFDGIAGKLHISEPELYVDNQSRNRSGHMSHAMVEFAPGKILDFNSNCSKYRCGGHSGFGWIEYRVSEDNGKTWGDINTLPCSMEILLDGVYTISVEKAVAVNGVITAFAIRNDQSKPISAEPWVTPLYVQSMDGGKSWTKPKVFSPYPGRIYAAIVHEGVIYVLQFCNPDFPGQRPTDQYRLFTSHNGGQSFEELSVVDIDTMGRAYGAMVFRPDGSLIAYNCNTGEAKDLAVSISYDQGKTWKQQEHIVLSHGIRNIQISKLGNGYVMHGRAWLGAICGKGLVMYTSKDALHWDDGILLNSDKPSCYYSNNLLLKDSDGSDKLLVQYDELYDNFDSRVNVFHRTLKLD